MLLFCIEGQGNLTMRVCCHHVSNLGVVCKTLKPRGIEIIYVIFGVEEGSQIHYVVWFSGVKDMNFSFYVYIIQYFTYVQKFYHQLQSLEARITETDVEV